MTTYVDDDGDGLPRCLWCADGECVSTGELCEDWVCRCVCKLRPINPMDEREPRPGVGGFGPRPAAQAGRGGTEQADQRPDAALANIARDIEFERYDPAALVAERFGRPTRSRA